MTDDDGADLTAGGSTVRGLCDNGPVDSSSDVAATAVASHFHGLTVFDSSRTNQIWAVGAERRGHPNADEFNTSTGESANVTANSANPTTPVRIGSIAASPTVEGSGRSGISSASAPGSFPGIDIQSLWDQRGQAHQPWITDDLFDSDVAADDSKTIEVDESRSLDDMARSAAKMSVNSGNAWNWGDPMQNVSHQTVSTTPF